MEIERFLNRLLESVRMATTTACRNVIVPQTRKLATSQRPLEVTEVRVGVVIVEQPATTMTLHRKNLN